MILQFTLQIFIIIFFCSLQNMYTDISEEWKNECEHIKQISQPIDLKSFGVDKMQKDIDMEFKVVQYMTQTEKHLKKLYTNPDHFSFNRNSNIMTYDQNRVLLGDQSEKDSADCYINANFIQIANHKIIATQGPLHSTFNNFWKMVQVHKVSSIFMLCQLIQKKKVKCDSYWPYKVQEAFQSDNYEIKLISQSEEGKYLKIRKFKVTNKTTKNQRTINHYQFIGWPDGDKPLQSSKNSLSKILQIMVNQIQKDYMVVVHCSAGVGRTGTFIAMAEIKLLIPKTQAISIFQIVRKLRQQRWAMVYTSTQYQYLYQFAESESIKFFQPEKAIKDEDSEQQNNLNDDQSGQNQAQC